MFYVASRNASLIKAGTLITVTGGGLKLNMFVLAIESNLRDEG